MHSWNSISKQTISLVRRAIALLFLQVVTDFYLERNFLERRASLVSELETLLEFSFY